jgi:hypothetical protein
MLHPHWVHHFWFGLIFIKKNNQSKFFFKKAKLKPVSVRFSYFKTKTGSNRFGSV